MDKYTTNGSLQNDNIKKAYKLLKHNPCQKYQKKTSEITAMPINAITTPNKNKISTTSSITLANPTTPTKSQVSLAKATVNHSTVTPTKIISTQYLDPKIHVRQFDYFSVPTPQKSQQQNRTESQNHCQHLSVSSCNKNLNVSSFNINNIPAQQNNLHQTFINALKLYKNSALEHLSALNMKAKMRNKNEEAINDLLSRIPEIGRTFDVHSRVGNGTFSTVLLATLKKERSLPESIRRKFAIKHHIPTSHPERILKELQCMIKMGGTDNVVGINCCIRCEASVAFIMPYMAHDRFHEFYTKMKPNEVRLYMRNLLIALCHVHKFNIIHRDIKPSNFLYNRRTGKFLLVDFGLAQHVPTTVSNSVASRAALLQQHFEIMSQSSNSSKRARDQDDFVLTDKGFDLIGADTEGGSIKRMCTNGDINSVHAGMGNGHKMPLKQLNEITVCARPSTGGISEMINLEITKKCDQKLQGQQQQQQQRQDDTTASQTTDNLLGSSLATTSKYNTNRSGSSHNKCQCSGNPHVCSICLVKKEVHASRAGTPGYRPPEVLLKYPDQTTAVDVWAAGVILLSILSSVYPFFKAPNDFIALAEIVTVFGDKRIRRTAYQLDRCLTLSQCARPLDLHKLCVRFRNRQQFSSEDMLRKHRKSDGSCEVCKNCDQYFFNCLCLESEYQTEFSEPYDYFPPSAYDLLLRLLEVNPHNRITAEEALQHPFLCEDLEEKTGAGKSAKIDSTPSEIVEGEILKFKLPRFITKETKIL